MALPRGIRNNNPLNIRKGNNWVGERHPQTDRSFEEFKTIVFGLRAGFVLIRNYIRGGKTGAVCYDTVDKIVRRWAPPIENATEKYIQFVADNMGVSRYEKLDFRNRRQMVKLVSAMCYMECGQWIDVGKIETAYDLL